MRWGRPRIAAAVALVAAAAAIRGYFATRTASAAAPITLAVLPFANIAGDSAMNFVADGLFDEVASALGRVPGILIKSRSGARAYRGQLAPDVTEAGARLKADYILTAVVRQDRGRWVLSADFERAADASSLWDHAFNINPNEQAAAADSIAGKSDRGAAPTVSARHRGRAGSLRPRSGRRTTKPIASTCAGRRSSPAAGRA